MTGGDLRQTCERVFASYHHPGFISPDPLEIVREYHTLQDREIAAFVSAALALGRVAGIVQAGRWVMERLVTPGCLLTMSDGELRDMAAPFVYRFFDGGQLYGLLLGLKRVVESYGSLEACFGEGVRASGAPPVSLASSAGGAGHATGAAPPVIRGLQRLVGALSAAADGRLDGSILVARPEKGSACKRLLLFLRWMVRADAVDPGGWTVISPSELLVPMDTHMLAVSRSLRLTRAGQPSLHVAAEVTAAFREICPTDPVRYDFSLTRMGINPGVRQRVAGRTGPVGGALDSPLDFR